MLLLLLPPPPPPPLCWARAGAAISDRSRAMVVFRIRYSSDVVPLGQHQRRAEFRTTYDCAGRVAYADRPALFAPSLLPNSDPAGQHEDEDDDQHQSQSAAWVIAPAAAVRPCRQGADQQENQDDQKDR